MGADTLDLDGLDHNELTDLVQRATSLLIQRVLAGHGSLAELEPLTADEAAAIIGGLPCHKRSPANTRGTRARTHRLR